MSREPSLNHIYPVPSLCRIIGNVQNLSNRLDQQWTEVIGIHMVSFYWLEVTDIHMVSPYWLEVIDIHMASFYWFEVIDDVRVVQLEEAWTVNHAGGRSSPSWTKLTKSLQQAFKPKIAGSFGSRPKPEGHMFPNNIVDTLKIHLCLSHTGAVSADVLHNAFVRITLTVPEVVDTENRVTFNLPFLLDPSSTAEMQS